MFQVQEKPGTDEPSLSLTEAPQRNGIMDSLDSVPRARARLHPLWLTWHFGWNPAI
jgi:hypothetical protein